MCYVYINTLFCQDFVFFKCVKRQRTRHTNGFLIRYRLIARRCRVQEYDITFILCSVRTHDDSTARVHARWCLLPAAGCLLLAACCWLSVPAACCLLAVCCLLPAACCWLPAVCCLLLTACCLRPAACLLAACCLLRAICCLLLLLLAKKKGRFSRDVRVVAFVSAPLRCFRFIFFFLCAG